MFLNRNVSSLDHSASLFCLAASMFDWGGGKGGGVFGMVWAGSRLVGMQEVGRRSQRRRANKY